MDSVGGLEVGEPHVHEEAGNPPQASWRAPVAQMTTDQSPTSDAQLPDDVLNIFLPSTSASFTLRGKTPAFGFPSVRKQIERHRAQAQSPCNNCLALPGISVWMNATQAFKYKKAIIASKDPTSTGQVNIRKEKYCHHRIHLASSFDAEPPFAYVNPRDTLINPDISTDTAPQVALPNPLGGLHANMNHETQSQEAQAPQPADTAMDVIWEIQQPVSSSPDPPVVSERVNAYAHRGKQKVPKSHALGVIDPYAAALFQNAFDKAIGVAAVSVIYQETLPLETTPEEAPPDGFTLAPTYCLNYLNYTISQVNSWRHVSGAEVDFDDHLANFIVQQMMYVSGETGEPSVETTGIIEDIVRQQVVELLRSSTELAARRGSRSININDLIFQIRNDAPKVSRLRTFLSWKDVRKNVKDSEEKGGGDDLGGGEDPVGGGVVPNGPVDDTAKKNKKNKIGLPWEPSSFYGVEVPEREDEEDEEEEEMNYITLQRLRKADERTKAMTKEEYVTWSEYRQASFTYRKGKRFREWAGFGQITDSKPSDDIVDILGFLTFEMVTVLTEEALKIKDYEDLIKERPGENPAGTKKRKLAQGLFDPPGEGRSPVEARHVQEAFRRLQNRPKRLRAMLNGTRLQQRTGLKIF